MIRRIATLCFAVGSLSAPAMAEDWSRPDLWRGAYLGVQGGGVNRRAEITDVTFTGRVAGASAHSGAGGLFAGYNWQSGPLVYGIETDWSRARRDADIGSMRGRLGWAYGSSLFYATAGAGVGRNGLTRIATGQTVANTFVGWTAGGGFESALPFNFSLRAEALYFDAGSQSFNFAASAPFLARTLDVTYHEVLYRVGLNYHFH